MTKTNEEILKEVLPIIYPNSRDPLKYAPSDIKKALLIAMDKARKEAEIELLNELEKKISKGGDCDCGYEIYLLQKKARGEK